jgi:hypothetical protein
MPTDTTYAYIVTIETERDYETLKWLADHGYDGSLMANSVLSDDSAVDEDGEFHCAPYVLGLTQLQAWAFSEYVDDDLDAFLSCCGSSTLSDALIDLWQSIV